jgi:hypothetical protein
VCGSCGGCRRRRHLSHRGHHRGARIAWRSPPRRSMLLARAASRSTPRHPRRLPAPHGGHHRGHPSSPPSPVPRPSPVEAVPTSVVAPVEAVPASTSAARRGRRPSAAQEGSLVGAERGGRGRQRRDLKLTTTGAVCGAVTRGGG